MLKTRHNDRPITVALVCVAGFIGLRVRLSRIVTKLPVLQHPTTSRCFNSAFLLLIPN